MIATIHQRRLQFICSSLVGVGLWFGTWTGAWAGGRAQPKYYVAVVTAPATAPKGDDPSVLRADVRVAVARDELGKALALEPDITSDAKIAKKWRLPKWSLDLGVTHFAQHYRNDQIELEAEIKVSVSDERGRIVSVITKTVTLPVRRCDYHPKLLKQFVRDLVMGATDSIAGELSTHLRRDVAHR